MNPTITPPDLQTIFKRWRDEIFNNLNCIQIGKISKFDKTKQSAEIEIQMKKKRSDTEIISYPLLVDCPVIFLQGGGTFIEFPIKKDDFCLILFNDKDIDNWFKTANVSEPNSQRKHSLSDGFALVGINPESSVLSLDNDKVRIIGDGYPIDIETDQDVNIRTDTDLILQDGTDYAVRYNELKTQLDQMKLDLNNFITAYNNHIHVTTATVGTGPVGTISPTVSTGTASAVNFSNTKINNIRVPGVGE